MNRFRRNQTRAFTTPMVVLFCQTHLPHVGHRAVVIKRYSYIPGSSGFLHTAGKTATMANAFAGQTASEMNQQHLEWLTAGSWLCSSWRNKTCFPSNSGESAAYRTVRAPCSNVSLMVDSSPLCLALRPQLDCFSSLALLP